MAPRFSLSRLVTLTVALFCAAPSLAQTTVEALEERLVAGPALSDVLEYAYRVNPTLEAARGRMAASAERYRVDTAYADPEVMLEIRQPSDPMYGLWVTQMIPFPGKLSTMGRIAEVETGIAEIGLDREARNLALRLRESYYELLYIRQARQAAAQNRELLENLRKAAETSYAQSRAQLLDVMKAQSQSAQLQYDALLLEELERTERARLNALLNRPPRAALGELRDEPLLATSFSLEEIEKLAAERREELRLAGAEVDKAEAELDAARLERYPDFTLGVFKDPVDANTDALGVQIGFTVPLWLGKNQGRIAEAQAKARTARAERAGMTNDVLADVQEAWFRHQNAQRLVTLYRDELLPQALRSMETAETWFRQGQGSFSDFVEVEAVYYNFSLALARATADEQKALARLEALAGRPLTRRDAEVSQRGAAR